MAMIWLISSIVFFVIEVATINMVTVWFFVGALASYFCAKAEISLFIQIVVFLAVSLFGIFIYKKFIGDKINNNVTKTNTDAIVGKTGLVTIDVDNNRDVGRVLVDGEDWRAVSIDGSYLKKDERIIVEDYKSTKLYVKRESKGDK